MSRCSHPFWQYPGRTPTDSYCFLYHHKANSAGTIQLHHPLPRDQKKKSFHKADIDHECLDTVIQRLFIQCAVVCLTLKQAMSYEVLWFRRLRKFNCSTRQHNLLHRWSLSLNRWSWSCRDLNKRHVWIHLELQPIWSCTTCIRKRGLHIDLEDLEYGIMSWYRIFLWPSLT